MKFNINDPIFNCLSINDHTKYFPSFVQNYLNRYVDYLHKNSLDSSITEKIDIFNRNIYICLLEYYCGQHESARFFFEKAIQNINFSDLITKIEQKVFYRARKSINKNTKLSNREMFHIPFEKRCKVSTERYSYPGLPCLYISSSYTTCCIELNNWDDDLNIALLKRISELNVLDLYFFKDFNFQKLTEEEYYKFISLWPIVSCCSFVYTEAENLKFRPDYIIPQLLLEYIIDKNYQNQIDSKDEIFHGISYYSVKTSPFELKNKHQINYVFPTIVQSEAGHCEILDKSFIVEGVYFLKELDET